MTRLIVATVVSFTLLFGSSAALAAKGPQTAKRQDRPCMTTSKAIIGDKEVVVGNLSEREVYLRLFRLTFYRAMENPLHEGWCRPPQDRNFLPTDKSIPSKCRVSWKRVSDSRAEWTWGPWVRKEDPKDIVEALKNWVRQEAPRMLPKMEFETQCVPDWTRHPEQRDNEIQLGYCHTEEFDAMAQRGLSCGGLVARSRYKSLRVGQVYYGIDGGVIPQFRPLFVERAEIKAAGFDPDMLEGR